MDGKNAAMCSTGMLHCLLMTNHNRAAQSVRGNEWLSQPWLG